MKLKYYIRGIGIGIIVTALILHFSFAISKADSSEANNKTNNDNVTLAESSSKNEVSVSDNSSISENVAPEDKVKKEPVKEEPAPDTISDNKVDEPDNNSNKGDDNKKGEDDNVIEPDDNSKMIAVIINGGDGSYTVAKKVQQVGLVDSAAKFDEFLCNNGYDKRLTVGTHKIKEGSDYKTIADELIKSEK